MANIISGSPITLEGMPPTDQLLAGIVYLSPTVAASLRDVVAHVVGNMEDEGRTRERDWILCSISLPGANYFLVAPPEDCKGNTVGPDRA